MDLETLPATAGLASAAHGDGLIAGERPVLARSLWAASAGVAPPSPRLEGVRFADVAIVGAGYTGLSAALHLAAAGRSVAVLDAHAPGWGASGRNGGQVIAGLKEDPQALERYFGPSIGRRLTSFSAAAPALVWSLIDRFKIACHDRRTGWLQPAANHRTLEAQAGRVRQWQDHGTSLALLDAAAMRDALGTGFYLGGMRDPRGGTLQPLAFAFGLARAASWLGIAIHGGSRVIDLAPSPSGWVLRTAHGRIHAGHVLLATNGYTDGLWPALARTVLPVCSVQVATAPLSPERLATILPGGEAASDAQRLLVYFRTDPDGRFVIGGRGGSRDRGIVQGQERLRRVAVQLYPELEGVAWPYAWGGEVALTLDHLPHLHEPAPGVLAGLGYNGRGVALATAMGRVLADRVLGRPEADLDLPLTPLRPVPLHRWRRPAIAAAIAFAGWRDRLDRCG